MSLARRISRFASDRRGVSAVEFALIAPLLITLYIGIVQVTLGLSADRKLTAAASTVADLVAQSESINGGGLADIFAAGDAVLQPYPSDGLSIRVTSLRADSAGNVSLVWSQGRGMVARRAGELPDLPEGVLLPDGGVIVVESGYAYAGPFGESEIGEFNLSETVYMRPRRVGFVDSDIEEEDGNGEQDGNDGGSDAGNGGAGEDSNGGGGVGDQDNGSADDADEDGSGADEDEGEDADEEDDRRGNGRGRPCRYSGILAFLLCR